MEKHSHCGDEEMKDKDSCACCEHDGSPCDCECHNED